MNAAEDSGSPSPAWAPAALAAPCDSGVCPRTATSRGRLKAKSSSQHSSSYTSPDPAPQQAAAHPLPEQLTQVCGSHGGQGLSHKHEGSVLPPLLLSWKMQTGGGHCCSPSPPAEVTSRRLKGLVPFFPTTAFVLFSVWGEIKN